MDHAPDTDREAIIAAIEGECAAYLAKDYALYATFWVQEDHIRRWSWHADVGMLYSRGWEAESHAISEGMRRFPAPIANDIRREWQDFIISGDLAWVTFDQYSDARGDPFEISGRQHEMRILQRQEGRWRIACVSNLKPWSEVAECPVVRVDGTGRVQWLNARAAQALGGHTGLAISGGRLRARNRASGRALQAAVEWAAGGLGYATKHDFLRARALTGGALPVMDAEEGDALRILCWVAPVDGMILVSFDDEAQASRRIDAAAIVFRLSSGQVRLVRLLMAGHDLAAAASALSVSVNTARTQLRRIFEKTGVHTQAALLRLMLSITPPTG